MLVQGHVLGKIYVVVPLVITLVVTLVIPLVVTLVIPKNWATRNSKKWM